MTDETFRRTMLLDFYGELLTDKQREYYDLHYNSDLSLYEIAEQSGVSRQAVWDTIRRADAILSQTEEKLGFAAKAMRKRRVLDEVRALLAPLSENDAVSAALKKLDTLED